MKKIIVLLVLFAWGMTSCDSTLDLDTNGSITMDKVFSDRNRTRGYLNSCYIYTPGLSIVVGAYTDDAQSSYDNTALTSYDYWYNTGVTSSSFGAINWDGDPWSNFFQGIRKCNVFLANIDASTAYATAAEKAGWKAQALTLRAFYYLQLFKRYGQVPLITEDLGTTHDYAGDTKASISAIVNQILADCDAALAVADGDDYSWNILDSQWGMMNKGVAWAIKSEAVTFAVSPLFDDGGITKEKALDVTKEALYQMLTHDYKLWTTEDAENGYNAYATYFFYSPNDKRVQDKETIYGGAQVEAWADAGLPTTGGMTAAGPCPTQDLVDAYEMANGETPITGYSDANHLQPVINSASGYDETNPYENRDPRFYATIFYNGSKRGSTIVNIYDGASCGIRETNIKYTHSGYYLRKYAHDKSNRNSNSDGYIRMIRLPEIYYNFAEVAYQTQGPDASINLGGSMSMSAREAVNAVRARVGMPGFPAGMTNSAFETKYRNERHIEYAMEQQRYFDIRRWKILGEKTKFVTGMRITRDGSNYTYTRFRFNDRPTSADKYLLYPINTTEANKIQTSTGTSWQNPGW